MSRLPDHHENPPESGGIQILYAVKNHGPATFIPSGDEIDFYIVIHNQTVYHAVRSKHGTVSRNFSPGSREGIEKILKKIKKSINCSQLDAFTYEGDQPFEKIIEEMGKFWLTFPLVLDNTI